ncbi:nitroreductase family deazaflavin-dependent oxidoreductase [Nocardia sp. CNY236]|uniref:nitroreductase family deazaflavin-dependent oxidoreductase n=1 Tax=Nocardia sp. CNY236 TaxID=1169152 RepID=UPI00041CCC35|nr:nitroreductase family deazaflavin-dependent oxidoreductase [Nocardia sp. CNY236]
MPLTGEYEPSTSERARKHAEEYENSGGTEGAIMQGVPIVLLTSKGAKTGKLRRTPLVRVEHGGEYAVVAGMAGVPKRPVWYYNVKAEPHVELRDGPINKDYTAREVFAEEKALWWARAVAVWPDYGNDETETDRRIPVFVLTPQE